MRRYWNIKDWVEGYNHQSKVDIISLIGSKARKATKALMHRDMLMAKKVTE